MATTREQAAPTDLNVVLTPEWLGSALGVSLDSVEVVETFVSVARKVRLRVLESGTADGSQSRAVFVKGIFDPGHLTPVMSSSSQTEARFYRDLVGGLGINHPPVRYVGIDPTVGHGLLVMDDISVSGARFLQVLSPYTRGQALASLDQIAQLHASHWNSTRLPGYQWMVSRLATVAARPWLPDADLQDLLVDGRIAGLPSELADAGRIHRALAALADRVEGRGETLVHGDAHAGNLYELNGSVSLIDWQLVQRSHWSIDVAYHVAAALSVDDRRASERDLIAHYLERLAAYGVEAPTFEEAFSDYRAAMVYGFYMWAITRRVDRPITVELNQRLGAAVADLGTFGVLGV